MSLSLESLTLNVNNATIAAIRQRDASVNEQTRMLCIHGWLDNANSFVPLMPYLPAFDLVAIDLPGHGHSDASVGGYSLHDLSFLIYGVMQALNWESCHLVGHSLGGGLVPLLAVSHPDCVQSLTMIESVGTLSEPADQLPQRMKKAFQDKLNPQHFESRVFTDKQGAIDARLKAAQMHPSSAKLIIDRQVQKDESGVRWRFDKRWRFASPQYFTEEQVHAVLRSVSCPVLTILADQGFLTSRPETEPRLSCLANHQTITLSGNHHVHMDTPEPVSAAINQFLKACPALGG